MTQLKKVTMSELKRYMQSNNHHFVTESKQHISPHRWTNLHTCILPPYEIYPAGGVYHGPPFHFDFFKKKEGRTMAI